MTTIRPTSGLQDILALRQEVLARSQALKDVRDAAGVQPASGSGPSAPPVADFGDTLGHALQQVSAVQQRSSDMQAAYERGEVTDIAQVMLARQEAGVAFEATLQVRNKLLSAYQDIMRMGS
ncbi:flagellar hook-basal body complex protein FliE [Erythrobacter sp. JK5]|uniref:flagellar hook-basal body complex protein FliE n=1 Tax=Erythrobacter sp. JK5 TaxID=2829500 RepID=UPI001BA71735|nr:flagellar hook-basal body complex protein FliE [Erythrobacter sp. JK5]QUL36915.1 flagellar hook-basal body complex protein FliE [Erythrobacter sp. JK5]